MVRLRWHPGNNFPPKYARTLAFAGRHPFQLFLLFASFLSGLPLVLSRGTGGPDVPAPEISVFIWGLMLVGGSITAVLGTYWPSDVITRMTIERIGLSAIGYGALLYGSITVIEAPSLSAALRVAVLLGFAVACLWRSYDIASEIRRFVEVNRTKDR